MKKPLIILTGPTAVGKTALSIQLAKKTKGEIISADSMQVYQHMNIGTAKIRPEEMEGVPHYLVDEFLPDESFHVAKFQEYALKYMEKIYEKNKIPILVGGTGFYIQAILYHIDFKENNSASLYRQELESLFLAKGSQYLHDFLKEVDEKSAETIHPNNVKRVIRALEYYKLTGEKISEHNEIERKKESPYHYVYFVLNNHRETLYQSIDKRVDIMIENGLIEEVKNLYNMGYKKELVSMQGLGYKEMIGYLENEYSLEEAIRILKRDTRHFAKRQLTWFRREKDVTWIPKNEFSSDEHILEFMLEQLKERGIQ